MVLSERGLAVLSCLSTRKINKQTNNKHSVILQPHTRVKWTNFFLPFFLCRLRHSPGIQRHKLGSRGFTRNHLQTGRGGQTKVTWPHKQPVWVSLCRRRSDADRHSKQTRLVSGFRPWTAASRRTLEGQRGGFSSI